MSRPVFTVGILAIAAARLPSIASASDTLRVAQTLAEIRQPGSAPILRTVVFGARGQTSVRTSSGLDVGGIQAPPEHMDIVVIPGMLHHSPADLVARTVVLKPEMELLRALHLRGVVIAGSCSGSVLLAETGLLDGHRATCSWWLAADFRVRYPAVNLEPDALVVEDGGVVTTGGACAVQMLMLRLITRAGGEELAQQTARMLLIDAGRQSQAPYVSDALIARPRHSLSEKAEHFLNAELHRDIGVAELAQACGTSDRSLLRHFRTHHGTTPQQHIQHLRVERAKALLESTHLTFEEIVERCGYSDAASFRRLFKRSAAMTPHDYRERFRLRPH